MVHPERLQLTAPLPQVKRSKPLVDSTGIIQLFGHCIATWYSMSLSHLKLTQLGTSCGRGLTATQKPINNYSF